MQTNSAGNIFPGVYSGLDGAPLFVSAALARRANWLLAGLRASSLAALFIFELLKPKADT